MKVLDRLKKILAGVLKRRNDDDGAEPALVGARLNRKPRTGAGAVALAEPE
jgi:hypothetical protein